MFVINEIIQARFEATAFIATETIIHLAENCVQLFPVQPENKLILIEIVVEITKDLFSYFDDSMPNPYCT